MATRADMVKSMKMPSAKRDEMLDFDEMDIEMTPGAEAEGEEAVDEESSEMKEIADDMLVAELRRRGLIDGEDKLVEKAEEASLDDAAADVAAQDIALEDEEYA